MPNVQFDKIAPPVAFVILGFIMIIIAGIGFVPFGNSPLVITEPLIKTVLVVLGVLLVLLGPVLVGLEIRSSKSIQESNSSDEQAREQIQNTPLFSGKMINLPLQVDTADALIRAQLNSLVADAKKQRHDPQPLNEIGMIYRDRLRDYGVAIWWFIGSIYRKPSVSYPYDRVGEIFEQLQEYDQAIQWFTRSANADPSNYAPCDRLGLLFRDKKRDAEQAITWFKKSIERKPIGNSIPYDRIAEIFRDQRQDGDEAINWFTKSAQADPYNHWPCDRLGEIYRDTKHDFVQAIKWFQESIARRPNNSWPHDRIAEIYRDYLHDVPNAIAWFEKSSKAEPNNSWPKERLKELEGKVK